MIEESKYCTDIMRKHFNKEFVITEKDMGTDNSTNCWICDNVFVEGHVKVRSLSYNWKK